MIRLETPKKFAGLVHQASQVARQIFRPISRRYDRAEHTYPRELDALSALLDGMYAAGGNSGAGIDCSGLVQIALLAAGHDCPGDSDLQEATVGHEIDREAPVEPGDLFFWKGHVAIALDPETLIHATAHYMSVVAEPLAEALARIEKDDSPLRTRRRL